MIKKFLTIVTLLTITVQTVCFAIAPSSQPLYNGIDVSRYQQNIDFDRVRRSGVDIVYIRSSAGDGFIDPYFEQNALRAKNAGLKIGFYHYLMSQTVEDAAAEARFFAETIAPYNADCRPALDYERFFTSDTDLINEIAVTFLKETERLSGKGVVLYSDAYNAENTFNITDYPLWIADYSTTAPKNSRWSTYVGFQYTDVGRIDGIAGDVDKDYFTKEIFTSDLISPPSDNHSEYTVKRGDTLWAIAKRFGTDIASLVRINNIKNRNLIYPGEKLYIPSHTEPVRPLYSTYTVKHGDTLWAIAKRYNVSISAIVSANSIKNRNLIYTGEQLRIPRW